MYENGGTSVRKKGFCEIKSRTSQKLLRLLANTDNFELRQKPFPDSLQMNPSENFSNK